MSSTRLAGAILLMWASACGSSETLTPPRADSVEHAGGAGAGGSAYGGAPGGSAGAADPADAAAPDLLRGLVAWYPMKGNAHDASGHGHDAAVHGVQLTSDRHGTPEAAYHFDGTTYLAAPGGSLPTGSGDRTVSAWVYAESVGTEKYKGNAFLSWGTGDCVGRMFGLGNCYARLIVWTGCADFHSCLSLPSSAWVLVVARFRMPDTLTVWAGDQRDERNTSTIATTPGTLFMGAESIDDGATFRHWFRGSVSDVRVYDRALSDEEVALLREP